jgi:hypothetical protein
LNLAPTSVLLLVHIPKVPGLILGVKTGHPDCGRVVVRGVTLTLQENIVLVPPDHADTGSVPNNV